MRGIISIKVKKCLGCKSCEIECLLAHSKGRNLMEVVTDKTFSPPGVIVEQIKEMAVPLRCAHCETAPCVAICPTGALSKRGREEPVVVDENMWCIGCGACVIVCPYGLIQLRKGGSVITKCDLCVERLDKDELPACVVGCPTGALEFVKLS